MKQLFCRISKVDEEKRLVTGIGASEAVDFEGEIFDYDGSKPYIEDWSAAAFTRSKGKSYGNVREMHQPSAAGKLAEPIVFDDANKLVILTSYISDDAAWKKCVDGTYTGFSICGPVIGEKWSDAGNPGVKRYICQPIEFSVCDLPCNPDATFTAVKAGGITEERKFQAKEPDVAKTNKAAIASPAEVAAKSLYSISDLAQLLNSLRYIQADSANEAEYEGDNSPVPDKLKAWMADGIEILVEMAREEGAEAVAAMKTTLAGAVAKAKKTPKATAMTALDSMGECLTKACKCQNMGKCMEKMAGAHQDCLDAVATMGDGEEKSSAAGTKVSKAVAVAAGAAPITTQAETPETGAEDTMDEAQKAELALAAKNSAEALEIAKANQAGQETILKALGTLLSIATSEPVAPKSVGPQATKAISKADENGGAGAVDLSKATPNDIAKSILTGGGKVLTRQEESGLNIGR